MVARVLAGSDGVRISRPGVDLYNYGNNNNLLLNIGTRSSQIIQQGGFPLTASSTQFTSSGGVNIGPFSAIPDIVWQLVFADGAVHIPPIIYGPKSAGFFLYNSAQIDISASRIDAIVPNNGNGSDEIPIKPSYFLFYLYRKGSFG